MDEDKITQAIAEAWKRAPYNAPDKCIDFALTDTRLPEFVRKALNYLDQDATTKHKWEREGKDQALYAKFNGRPCRVTIVSRMGDIGISWDMTRRHGYNERGLSIYDLSDYSETPHPEDPRFSNEKPSVARAAPRYRRKPKAHPQRRRTFQG